MKRSIPRKPGSPRTKPTKAAAKARPIRNRARSRPRRSY